MACSGRSRLKSSSDQGGALYDTALHAREGNQAVRAGGCAPASDMEPETLEVAADTELLEQALINLTRNAMDAVRDEGAARISLSAHQEPGAHVVITVADNGPGIPPEQRDKVFVPFFTTKRQGSGVGLTLVRQIATVHGATVNISDSPGGGARVRIRF